MAFSPGWGNTFPMVNLGTGVVTVGGETARAASKRVRQNSAWARFLDNAGLNHVILVPRPSNMHMVDWAAYTLARVLWGSAQRRFPRLPNPSQRDFRDRAWRTYYDSHRNGVATQIARQVAGKGRTARRWRAMNANRLSPIERDVYYAVRAVQRRG